MAEPHASAASAAAGSAFGFGLVAGLTNPILQHWALVAVGIVAGAILAVQSTKTESFAGAAGVFSRAVIIAGLFTSIASVFAAPILGTTYDVLLMPVAGLLAWHHDRMGQAVGPLLDRLAALFGRSPR